MSDDLSARIAEAAAKYADDGNGPQLAASAAQRLQSRRRWGYKVCPSCEEARKPDDFGQDSRERDGLRRVCRDCRKRPRVNDDLA